MVKRKIIKKNLLAISNKNLTLFIGIGIGFSITLMLLISMMIWVADRPWPGISLANQSVAFTHKTQIQDQLTQQLNQFNKIILIYQQQTWEIPLTAINYQPHIISSIRTAIDYQKNWVNWNQLPKLIRQGINLPVTYTLSQTQLDTHLQKITDQLFIPAIEPEVSLKSNADSNSITSPQIQINPGTQGQQVDLELLQSQIHQSLSNLNPLPITIPIRTIDLRLTETQQSQLYDLAQKLLNKQLILHTEQDQFIWEGSLLVGLLKSGGYQQSQINEQLQLVARQTNIPVQNAVFKFNQQTHRVEEFKSEVLGRILDIDRNQEQIISQINFLAKEATLSAQVNLTYRPEYPEIKVANINQLGIEELIGTGTSKYKGSIVNRIHNLTLAANQLSGVIIKPGQEFSFNQQVGEVNAATGYKKAYIIRSGQTILDDGGGVCQVSTTLFRAALNAGLPITERHAHAYRVYYYEQDTKPGLDATVYAPSVDLKFINDTPGHILIESQIDKNNYQLTFNIYGTSDGRTVEITNQRLWAVSAPPEDLKVDDPSLPTGQIKQIEYKAWGAKAAFDWLVTRDGEIIQERTFYSNYRPWGAVFLQGTGPSV